MPPITIRLAWHQDGWNGSICSSNNIYCEGHRSLLSGRIKKWKEWEKEERYGGEKADKMLKEKDKYGQKYVPPCYWSINLLGKEKIKVIHYHPFRKTDEELKTFGGKGSDFRKAFAKDTLKPYSVFTWPFRFSFNRDGKEGERYPPNLEDKIKRFIEGIEPKIAFLYLNYDNPVLQKIADEGKFIIVGVGKIKKIDKPRKYDRGKEIIKKMREKELQ